MRVLLSRDSVAAGDDVDAPHKKTLSVPNSSNLEDTISIVVQSGYLASVSGGKATWSANSRIPLAVIAQEWEKPKMIAYYSPVSDKLVMTDDGLHLHFTYYAQRDPHVVFEILQRYSSQL